MDANLSANSNTDDCRPENLLKCVWRSKCGGDEKNKLQQTPPVLYTCLFVVYEFFEHIGKITLWTTNNQTS
jgi:hypothetical protein